MLTQTTPALTLITEATFALPCYRWPPVERVGEQIWQWWAAHPDRPCILFTYALGKAQRVLAVLTAHADRPVLVHGAMVAMTEIYRQAGVQMLPRATCIRWARAADLECFALSGRSLRVPDTLQSGRLRPCPRACRNS